MYGWVGVSGEKDPGDQVRVMDESHPAFRYGGTVMAYNARTSEARIDPRREVDGTRIGIIPHTKIVKIHGMRGGGYPMTG